MDTPSNIPDEDRWLTKNRVTKCDHKYYDCEKVVDNDDYKKTHIVFYCTKCLNIVIKNYIIHNGYVDQEWLDDFNDR